MSKYKAAAALAAALATTAPFVGAFAQVEKSGDVPGLQVRDPSDPKVVVPPAGYNSAFARYRPNAEVEVGAWREKNDGVGRIGGWRVYGSSNTRSSSCVLSGTGGGFNHTSRSPWRCTSARALPGLASMCRMREACAYNTGSAATASYDGSRMTLRSRSTFGTRP